MIGGRKVGFARLPSLRTVRAVLPHTARQLVVANNGLIETKMGLAQTIETRFREVVIRPTLLAICLLSLCFLKVSSTFGPSKQQAEPTGEYPVSLQAV